MRGAPAILVVFAGLLVGCSATDHGQAVPTPPVTTTTEGEPTSTRSQDPAAPPVDNPLDAAKFIDDPCLSLTAAQADELGVPHPGTVRDNNIADSICTWENDARGLVEVAWFGSTGVGGAYAAEKRGDLDFFAPAEVNGYPAAEFAQVDRRDRGYCSVAVGTAEEQSFQLSLRQSEDKIDGSRVCSIALEVAGKVVDTVRGN